MDRRGFLTTTFSGGLAASATACAGNRTRASDAPLDDAEFGRRLHRIDRTMDRMDRVSDRWFLDHRKRASGVADDPSSLAEGEQIVAEGELLRASMRSMFMTSSLSELPEAQYDDPRVVERLRRVSGEADFAVFGTLARLESLDATQLATIDEAAKQPDFLDRVLEDIDGLSGDLDVPAGRRLHLRRLAKQLSWKLERQPMSALIRETVDSVCGEIETWSRRLEKLGPQPVFADGDPRWIERTQAVVKIYARADEAPSNELAPYNEIAEPVSLRNDQIAKAQVRVRQGQIMLGVGLGLALLGGGGAVGFFYAGLIPGGITMSVVATIGVILLIIGAVFWGLGNHSLKDLGAR